MINFKQGSISTYEGAKKDIVVKALLPNKAKDIVIGSLLIGAGVLHLTATAFKNGSEHFEQAEYDTLMALGLLKDPE